MQLTGIHHLTAVTADAPRNLAFYTRTLGMRLVKKTVNQDDTSAYHLFYADGMATPGTDLTFFDWPVARERRGTHSISRTRLRVAGEDSLRWWKRRFVEQGVAHGDIVERDGRRTLDFEDFEGQRLSLVEDGGAGEAHVASQPRAGRTPDPGARPDHDHDRPRADACAWDEPSPRRCHAWERRLTDLRLPHGRRRTGSGAACC